MLKSIDILRNKDYAMRPSILHESPGRSDGDTQENVARVPKHHRQGVHTTNARSSISMPKQKDVLTCSALSPRVSGRTMYDIVDCSLS